MVCYCCVKDCKNNNNIKKKDLNSTISFHAFPTNPELKSRWLKAIGRPNWEPPMYSRICSVHFRYDQISREGFRTRIKDNACPTNFLPLNSNFEASELKVCRICLATEIKMYSLRDGILKTCIDTITGFNDSLIEGMPQFVCYECGACLIKCYYLKEKSMVSQATLLDIFVQNGKLTMTLIKKQDREKLNLRSSLSCYKTTNIYNFIYETEDVFSSHKNEDYGPIDNDEEYFKKNTGPLKLENVFINEISKDTLEMAFNVQTNNEEVTPVVNDININEANTIYFNEENNFIENEKDCISLREDISNNVDVKNLKRKGQSTDVFNEEENISTTTHTKKKNRKCPNLLTPSETNMQEHFDIVILSLQEQIEEWKRTAVKRALTSETIFKCAICLKKFSHIKTYQAHVSRHNPSHGKEECPVCKLRFPNEALMRSHRKRTHGKKFYCKKCSKVFNTVGVAKKHHRWHCGHKYKCSWCTFKSAHESAVGVHARKSHGARACVLCGVACTSARGLSLHTAVVHRHQPVVVEVSSDYRCEECDVNFASEKARRVHLLTSEHKKTQKCDATGNNGFLKKICRKCGQEFSSHNDLTVHTKSEHWIGPRRKTSWKLPGDSYPSLCEHCDKTVNNRKEHWWHVRQQHPKEKHLYQPVITAICDICGKGFQNSTKLNLHELRHGKPTVKCVHCPRLFYDKYAVARHVSVHQPIRPYSCRVCGRAFRLKGNLQRHSRVFCIFTQATH